MEITEIKQRIQNYFVDIKEDKFTKVKSVKCKHKIEWTGKDLENNFMLTNNSMSNSLSMSIEYRHKDDIDSVFFVFTYSSVDGGFPGMSNIKMYLILDDNKTIELSDASGFDHASQTSNSGGEIFNAYIETAQLTVSISDFIAIANATKIEYSIRFGHGALEKTFDLNEIILFQGFYNAAFDEDFKLENLRIYSEKNEFANNPFYQIYISRGYLSALRDYQQKTGCGIEEGKSYIDQFEKKVNLQKSEKYKNSIEKYFLLNNILTENSFDKEDSIKLIISDNGFSGSWPNRRKEALILTDLKVGIKTNSLSKAPDILFFPEAVVHNQSVDLVQINYADIFDIELKKSLLGYNILINTNKGLHKINGLVDLKKTEYLIAFIKSQIGRSSETVTYIKWDSTKTSLISKYNISELDKQRLFEIEIEKAQLGFISIKKEKLKSETHKILKSYDVKFLDYGNLIDEIQKESSKK